MRQKATVFVLCILLTNVLTAQKKVYNQYGFYKKEMKSLLEAIQKNFYDSAGGYYKEKVLQGKDDKPYSYLWGICAMYQAANEVEEVEQGSNHLQPILAIIRDYYDPAPPSPG